jgi:hypothetical protein
MVDSNALVDKALDKIGELTQELVRSQEKVEYWQHKAVEVARAGEELLVTLREVADKVDLMRAEVNERDATPPEGNYEVGYVDGMLHVLGAFDA